MNMIGLCTELGWKIVWRLKNLEVKKLDCYLIKSYFSSCRLIHFPVEKLYPEKILKFSIERPFILWNFWNLIVHQIILTQFFKYRKYFKLAVCMKKIICTYCKNVPNCCEKNVFLQIFHWKFSLSFYPSKQTDQRGSCCTFLGIQD